MDAPSRGRDLRAVVLTAGGLALLAAFLPWMTAHGPVQITSINGEPMPPTTITEGPLAEIFNGAVFTATGWSGNLSLLGASIPTWIIPALALFVMAQTLVSLVPRARVPRWLPLAFAVAGVVAVLALGVWVLIPDGPGFSRLEAGWYLELASFVLMAGCIVRDGRSEPGTENSSVFNQRSGDAGGPARDALSLPGR